MYVRERLYSRHGEVEREIARKGGGVERGDMSAFCDPFGGQIACN